MNVVRITDACVHIARLTLHSMMAARISSDPHIINMPETLSMKSTKGKDNSVSYNPILSMLLARAE